MKASKIISELTTELEIVLDEKEQYQRNQELAAQIVKQMRGLTYFQATSVMEIIHNSIKHQAKL